jgi:hypothetical protein
MCQIMFPKVQSTGCSRHREFLLMQPYLINNGNQILPDVVSLGPGREFSIATPIRWLNKQFEP